jgi:glycosyltransferase involved in cell wall biosynthesis
MRIVIVGPGLMPIPPTGWGAIEILVWEYYVHLKKNGIDAHIVNKADPDEIIADVNRINPDIVHLQYEDWFYLWDSFDCKNVLVTNHYAYILCPHRTNPRIVNGIINSKLIIHCLSKEIYDFYIKLGVNADRLFLLRNGGSTEQFKYVSEPNKKKAIYLAKIDFRKRQFVYQNIPEIDFAGNLADSRFNPNRSNYLGEWSKELLYQNLSEYSTLVLLSDGEAHALVCSEALICGLGLVVSPFAVANLDTSKPFITVIPVERLDDIDYVRDQIKKNIEVSSKMRDEIREYGLNVFSWDNIVKEYIQILQKI